MEFLRELFATSAAVETIGVFEMIRASLLAFGLSLGVGYLYSQTHQGPSYSQTTVHTMVIMSVVITLIMLIIGTNIARAFTLVGALSIIRFRNAVKESRDVAFYFLTMGIGMACGTGFLFIAIVFTLIVCSMIYFLTRFNIGAKSSVETMLRLSLGEGVDYRVAFDQAFFRHLADVDLLSVDSDGSGELELLYNVRLRPKVSEQALLQSLHEVDESVRAQLVLGHSSVNL
jgi:uncharacterized membrane protein YhiD involved in acid resistance